MKNYGGSCGANLNFKGRERLAVMMEMAGVQSLSLDGRKSMSNLNGVSVSEYDHIGSKRALPQTSFLYTMELNKCAWQGIVQVEI